MDFHGSQCGLRWQMVMEIKLLDPCVAKERKKKEKERKEERKKER